MKFANDTLAEELAELLRREAEASNRPATDARPAPVDPAVPRPEAPSPELISVTEAAARLGESRPSVYRRIEKDQFQVQHDKRGRKLLLAAEVDEVASMGGKPRGNATTAPSTASSDLERTLRDARFRREREERTDREERTVHALEAILDELRSITTLLVAGR